MRPSRTAAGTSDAFHALSDATNAVPPGPTQHAIQNSVLSKLAHQPSTEQVPHTLHSGSRPIYHGSLIELPSFIRAINDKLPQNVQLFQFAVNGYYSHHTNGKTIVPNLGMAHAIDTGAHLGPGQ